MATQAAAQFLAFRAGDRRYCVAADQVREVARIPKLTPVPHAPASLLGIGNVRGEAVAIVSAARLLNTPAGNPRQVIRLDGEKPIALAIDRVESIIGQDAVCERPDFADLLRTAFPERSTSRGTRRATSLGATERRIARLALLCVAVGDQLFALPLDTIETVLRVPNDLAQFPHGDAATLGTIAWRDGLVPVFSLAALLALPAQDSRAARIVVVRLSDQVFGVMVDRVEALLRPPTNSVDPVPVALLRGEAEAVIQSIHRSDGGRLISILAADRLLREDITARIVANASQKAAADAQADADTVPLLLFESAGQRFAFPLDAVDQIAASPMKLTPLPQAPAFLPGVTSHRGEAVPVVDLSVHLGGPPATGPKSRLLMVSIGGAGAALRVDSVDSIARVRAGALADAPPLGAGRTQSFGQVATLGDSETVTLVLSPVDLFTRLEADLISGATRGTAGSA